MHKNIRVANRYAYCGILSVLATLLGFSIPLLSSLAVDRGIRNFSPGHLDRLAQMLPMLILLLSVQGTRIYLRFTISTIVGSNQKAPLFWLQHRIGKWLWWVEPMVHDWGVAGMIISKISGKKGLAVQIASSTSYVVTDMMISFISGMVYYITQSYILSLLSSLALPTLAIIPWFTQKSLRIRQARTRRHAPKTW